MDPATNTHSCVMKKVLLTGGSGILGLKLREHLTDFCTVYAPTSVDCNILNESQVAHTLESYDPDIVIHLAAFVDTFGCESDISRALDINVIGTVNIVKACNMISCKLVYISSEYVFSGKKGNYSVYDKLDPINVYGKTKAAAEYIASTAKSHQIIRAPFIKKAHTQVFTDQYCTRYFINNVVSKITTTVFENGSSLVQVAPYRDTLYNT